MAGSSQRLGSSDARDGCAWALVEALAVPVVVCDTTGVVVVANREAEEMLAYAPGGLTGLPVEQLVPLVHRETHAAQRRRYTNAPARRRMGSHVELTAETADGRVVPVEIALSPIEEDGERYVVALITDLRPRLAQQREIERARELLAQALDLARMGYWVEDLETGEVHTSPEFRAMVGTTLETTDFETLTGWIDPHDRAALSPIRERGLRGEDTRYEFRLVTSSGEVRHAQALGTSLGDEPRRRLGVVQDITSLREAESALVHLQKLEAVGRLAGGVAHDFNNLITVITGYAQLARLAAAPPAVASAIGEIERAATRAAELTSQLLTVSRRQRLRLGPVSVNDEVARMAELIGRVLPESIVLDVRLAADPPRCMADSGAIEQILLNLATNARDAMPHGGRLRLETSSDGDHVRVTVGDSGIGMDSHTRERLFEPFFTTKPAGEGTGLGLSIVHALVSEMGGTIAVETELAVGSTFTICLPGTTAPAIASPAARPEARATVTGAPLTILVCEDHEALRSLLVDAIRAAGHRALPAGNGREALEVADAHDGRIDVLFTDLVMPEMGGSELAGALTRERPTTRVVFTSGYDQVEFRTRLTDGTAFVQKPYTAAQVIAVLEQVARG